MFVLRFGDEVFEWKKYLQSYDFINRSGDGKSLEIVEKDFKIRCEIYDEDQQNIQPYYQNSRSIEKGKKIKFTLYYENSVYNKQPFEHITWEAINRGTEAKDHLRHEFWGLYKDKTVCIADAAYLGHHYVSCRITRDHSDNKHLTFPVFVIISNLFTIYSKLLFKIALKSFYKIR